MMEPVTLLAGFLTIWAQFHNYGIDSENPELKNIRVRREIAAQLYGVHNRVHNGKEKDLKYDSAITNQMLNNKDHNRANKIDYKPYKLQNTVQITKTKDNIGDSIIMKSIFNGNEQNRLKRSYKSNYNGNNNNYIEGKVPLANYAPNSPYYSQNTAGVTYYYTDYNNNGRNGINNGYNGNNNAYKGYNRETINTNSGQGLQNSSVIPNRESIGHDHQNLQAISSKYVMPNNFNMNNNANSGISQANYQGSRYNGSANNTYGRPGNQGNMDSRQFYNPTVKPYGYPNKGYNVNNNGNNNSNKNNNTVIVDEAHFMSGVGCPKFMSSVTLFGSKVCVNDDY